MRPTSIIRILVFYMLTLTIIYGCKKDDSRNYAGDYAFQIINSGNPDSTIYSDGSISYDKDSKILTVNFMKQYNPSFSSPVYPHVEDNGTLSYPEYTNKMKNYFFSGTINGNGFINFKIGYYIYHFGAKWEQSTTVRGEKK